MTTEDQGIIRQRTRRSLDLQTHEGTVEVKRVAYGREAEETLETIRVPLFTTEVARVRVNGGVSRNLGDFNHARVDVSIEMPCYPEDSEIRRTYDYLSAMLDELIPEQVDKAVNG